MALEFINFCANEQQFFDDNMLTNEDFNLDENVFEDIPDTEDSQLKEDFLEFFTSMPNLPAAPKTSQPYQLSAATPFVLKSEPLSPSSSSTSSGISSNGDASPPPPATMIVDSVPEACWSLEVESTPKAESPPPTLQEVILTIPSPPIASIPQQISTIAPLASNITSALGQKPVKGSKIVPLQPQLIVAAPDSTSLTHQDYWKKEQRKLKNRESANLSRLKKKEYVQKLEQEIKQLTTDNSKLKSENTMLKSKISHLQRDYQSLYNKLMNTSPSSLKKTAPFLLACCIFIFTFNFNYFTGSSIPSEVSNPALSAPPSSVHRSRSLLWEDEANKSLEKVLSNFSNFSLDMCPLSLNQAHLTGVENQIRCWIRNMEKELERKEQRGIALAHLQSQVPYWLKKRPRHHKKQQNTRAGKKKTAGSSVGQNQNEFALQLYQPPGNNYGEFFEAINRRNDTFYFISLSGDHLLLPATAHNKTMRPRMSVVMPAMVFNESLENPKEYVTMMQIDCEVTDAKYIYVKESTLPVRSNVQEQTPPSISLLQRHAKP